MSAAAKNELVDIIQFLILEHLSRSDFLSLLRLLRDILVVKSVEYDLSPRRRPQFRRSELQAFAKHSSPDTGNSALSDFRYCLLTAVCINLLALLSGLRNHVVIGIFMDSGKLHSHAWVEFYDGSVADTGFSSSRYKEIARFTLDALEGL